MQHRYKLKNIDLHLPSRPALSGGIWGFSFYMIKDNYIVIQGWMVSNLELSGNDLLAFALIYGFCQDGESEFTGSIKYVCNWLNCSKPTAMKAIQNLVDKSLILKQAQNINNVIFNRYKVNLQVVKNLVGGSKESLLGGKETLRGGGKETLPNNTILDNNNNKYIYIGQNEKNEDIDISFSFYFDEYSKLVPEEKTGKKIETEKEWNKLNLEEKQKVIEYVEIVKNYGTPKQFLPSPLNLLVYKKYLTPPHEHKEKLGGVEGYNFGGLTKEENDRYYSRQSKDEIIELIKSGQEKKILSFTSYEFTCKKYNLEQRYTDSYIFYGCKI